MPKTGPGRPRKPPQKTTTQLVPFVWDHINAGLDVRAACKMVAEGTSHSVDSLVKAFYVHAEDESVKAHGHCTLDAEEELALACTIAAFDLSGVALPQHSISVMAENVYERKLDAAWFHRFYKRHEDILVGRRKRRDKRFSGPAAYREEGVRWVKVVGSFLARQRPPPHAQFNPDETRVYEKDGAVYLTRVGARGRDSSTIDSDGERTLGTYIPFPAGDGSMLMSVYVLKANFNDGVEAVGSFYLPFYVRYATRDGYAWPIYFMFTQTSYLTKESWKKILELFEHRWNLLYSGLHCVLWLDYADIHYQPQVILDLAKRGIFTLFFMKKSTKVSQPADRWMFAALKHLTIKILADEKLSVALNGGKWGGSLWHACFEAEKAAFTPRTIQASFRDTGTLPWNPDLFLKRLDEALGAAEYDNPVVTLAVEQAEDVCKQHQSRPPQKKHKTRVEKNVTYEYLDLQALVDAETLASQEAAEFAKRKAQQKEERRRKQVQDARDKEKRKREREETKRRKVLERAETRRASEENRAQLRKERIKGEVAKRRDRLMKTCNGDHEKPPV